MEFKDLAIALLQGVLYKEEDPKRWEALLYNQGALADYFAKIGLLLVVDNEEGYAYLKEEEHKLLKRTTLSFHTSFLLALLRQKLAQNQEDVGIVFKEEILQKMTIYLSDKNEERSRKQIESAIKKAIELGFLKEISTDTYKIRPAIKAFVDAQWLESFDKKLQEYIDYAKKGS